VIHESPHRVIDLMTVLAETLPGTFVSASCDLTKKFEQTTRGIAGEVLEALKNNPKADKGEYCIALCWAESEIPRQEQPKSGLSLEAQLFDGLIRGLSLRDSMEELIAQGERKNAVKAASLRVKSMLADE
jgi:16S rRNA C1402 (ribose-2'-O) methylase RsmI